jgi:hypothetical protein
MGGTKNPDDNTLRERADIYLLCKWNSATNGLQPRLFDPPAVQTSGTLPHMWGPYVGLSHWRLMAFVKLHHDNHVCPIKAVSNHWGWICAQQEFSLKMNGQGL